MLPQLVFAVMILSGLVLANEEPATEPTVEKPKSAAAQTAIRHHDIVVSRAEIECQRAIAAADKQLILDLDDALKVAMKAGNLDEAKRIDSVKKEAEGSHQDSVGQLKEKAARNRTFTIEAAKPWQPTIFVKRGQKLKITAKGQWCGATGARAEFTFGPDGAAGKPLCYLEGRVAGRVPFKIGSAFDFTAKEDGELEMEMMDPGKTDNDGALTVTILSGN